MIKQLFCACIIGLCTLVYYVQQDEWCRNRIAKYVIGQMQSSLQCTIEHYTVKDLSLLRGTISFSDILLKSCDMVSQDWSLHADLYALTMSWKDFLFYGTINLSMRGEHIDLYSACRERSIALYEHCCRCMSGAQWEVPIIVKDISLKDITFTVRNHVDNQLYIINGAIYAKKMESALKSIINIESGVVRYADRVLCDYMYGAVEVHTTHLETDPHVTIKGSCSIHMPWLEQDSMACNLNGSWHDDQGVFDIKNSDHSFQIIGRTYGSTVSVTAQAPLSVLYRCFFIQSSPLSIDGTAQLHAKGAMDGSYVNGYITAKQVMYAGAEIGSLGRITFKKNNNKWAGILYGQRNSGATVQGKWKFDQLGGNGTISIANQTPLMVAPTGNWNVPVRAGTIECEFDISSRLKGEFAVRAQHAKIPSYADTHGTIIVDMQGAHINGKIQDYTYDLLIKCKPYIHLAQCICKDVIDNNLLSMTSSDDKESAQINGVIDFALIRAIGASFGSEVQGEGSFDTSVTYKDQKIYTSLVLRDGAIRLPKTYNFIKDFCVSCVIDSTRNRILVDTLHCVLYKGSIESARGTVYYTQDMGISSIFMPLIFNDCLLNVQKDLFAIVSGRLVLQKVLYKAPILSGSVILDRSRLNENIFSQNVQQSLIRNAPMFDTRMPMDIGLDINLLTGNPVQIKTPFLEMSARMNVAMSGSMYQPAISGTIVMQDGVLLFPYAPLYIHKGTIYFIPHQLSDPLIELVAKNSIKKYNLVLQATGSLQNHHISLHSNPPLTEEQIVALLLVGSQEESLNIVMPALIMQNIKQLLFGSDQTRNALEHYFMTLLKPFKHVRLVPSFVDQTGRGGLRAAVEITAHERLRALIQKNFSLSEDTRFELEYMLSDDISVRATRDERRDLSGEIEMRWKF